MVQVSSGEYLGYLYFSLCCSYFRSILEKFISHRTILFQDLQRIQSRSLEFLYSGTESASGLLVDCDYMLVIKSFEMQVLNWRQQWIERRNWEGKSVLFINLSFKSADPRKNRSTNSNRQIQASGFSFLLSLRHAGAKFLWTAKRNGACTIEYWPLLRSGSYFCHCLRHACSR